jgi:hypothetical protein
VLLCGMRRVPLLVGLQEEPPALRVLSAHPQLPRARSCVAPSPTLTALNPFPPATSCSGNTWRTSSASNRYTAQVDQPSET